MLRWFRRPAAPPDDDVEALHRLLDRLHRAERSSSPAVLAAHTRELLRTLQALQPRDPWTARWLADWLTRHAPQEADTVDRLRSMVSAMAPPGTAETAVLLADEEQGTAMVGRLQVSVGPGALDVWTPGRNLGDLALAAADVAMRVEPESCRGVVRWEISGLPERAQVDGGSLGLPLAVAIRAAARRRPLPADWALTGRLRIQGHIDAVGSLESKLRAAGEAGFRHVVVPAANRVGLRTPAGIEVHFAGTLAEALGLLFPTPRRRWPWPVAAAAMGGALWVGSARIPRPPPPLEDLVVVLMDAPTPDYRTWDEDRRRFYQDLPIAVLRQGARAVFLDAAPVVEPGLGADQPGCQPVHLVQPALAEAERLDVPMLWGANGQLTSALRHCGAARGFAGELDIQVQGRPLLRLRRCYDGRATMPEGLLRALRQDRPASAWATDFECADSVDLQLPPGADLCQQPFAVVRSSTLLGHEADPHLPGCDRPIDLRGKVVLLGDPRNLRGDLDHVEVGEPPRPVPGTLFIAWATWSLSAIPTRRAP